MRHILKAEAYFESNDKHMAFLASNSSAGAQGKELRPAGPTVPKMSQDELMQHLSNAFGDQKITFRKMKHRQKKRQAAKLFLKQKKKK